jgi:hypothetical protein
MEINVLGIVKSTPFADFKSTQKQQLKAACSTAVNVYIRAFTP